MLSSESKTGNECLVPGHIFSGQIVQKTPAPSHHLQQSPACCVVVAVDLKMPRELGDAPGKECYLDLGGAGVSLVGLVLLNDLPFGVLIQPSCP